MITPRDKWFRIGFVAVPALSYLCLTLAQHPITLSYLCAVSLFNVTLFVVNEGNRWIINKTRSYIKPPFRKLKRGLAVLIGGIVFTATALILGRALRNLCLYGEWNRSGHNGASFYVNDVNLTAGIVGSSFFYGILLTLLLYGVYELFYHFARLSYSEKERNRLEKEKLVAELQQLKGIVNPHFLFNNLNSLSSLISEDPIQAEAFLDELTKVFRYLLRNNHTELTSLNQELEFLESYYKLLQTRHGEGIVLKQSIDPDLFSFLLPPMTLQLLVENAVKHNRVHRDQPLTIELYSEGLRLMVRNNLSKKESRVESTGVGLNSINARYRLMNLEGLLINKTESFFSVAIPLVEPHIKKYPAQESATSYAASAKFL